MRPRVVRPVWGPPDATRDAILAAVRSELGRATGVANLWVGDDLPLETLEAPATHGFVGVAARSLARHLGTAAGHVVLDLYSGLQPDLLGQAAGMVVAGGTLWVRIPEQPVPSASLEVWPYSTDDVTTHTWSRVVQGLSRSAAASEPSDGPVSPGMFAGTPDQDAVVTALREGFVAGEPAQTGAPVFAVLADRGRGKSTALGRAADGLRATVTAAEPRHAAEVLRFATDARYADPLEILTDNTPLPGPLLVDEAAALSVPLLHALLERARADAQPVAFATTVHGYEGHGRGFALRFLPTVSSHRVLTLSTPIRWGPDDPLEEAVRDVLLLDATDPARSAARPRSGLPSELEVGRLDRDALAADEARLRAVFGLLVEAHYRTTPADLQRLLDAPNLAVHAVWSAHDPTAIHGVCLVAREGGLPPPRVDALVAGRRIRGHALAETLAVHSGWTDAATWPLLRSVRIATDPAFRRQGVARMLVEHIHEDPGFGRTPALFGTLFGATPGLLAFRRSLGYRLVRVGVSRGSRTGEPTAVMVRPTTPEATAGVAHLRRVLARDLPLLLDTLAIDGLPLSDAARTALLDDLPEPLPYTYTTRLAAIRAWTHGPRPYDAVATAVVEWLAQPEVSARLASLPPDQQALIRGRVVERRSWRALAREASLSVPATMRALRRVGRDLVESTACGL